ncbi:MAG: divalent-cation tolerance protein CutA [Burkholderiaceae bacterium]
MSDVQVLMVMSNAPDQATAHTLAHALVEAKLAACVNILPGVKSVYRWQGDIEHAEEVTLLIKTTRQHYAQLQQALVHAHPYDLPEVIAWPIAEGYAPYLHWIASETTSEKHA